VDLFKQAGWNFQNNTLVNAKTGEPFTIEFLENDPSYERVVSPFIANLKRVGINARLRIVDSSQYVERVNNFDFDVISSVIGQSQSPGNEQREMWSSLSADQKGSRNFAGIKNPAIDKLIDRVLYAKDRDELVAATHALDRALLWNWYVVPQWYSDEIRIAYWNKFGIPEKQPDYVGVDTDSWWIDPAKEKVLGAAP
jgi:microcin C transport system substrate-binding protein